MSIEWQMAFGNKEPYWIVDTPNEDAGTADDIAKESYRENLYVNI